MTIKSAAFLPGTAPTSSRVPLGLAPGDRSGPRLLVAEPRPVTSLGLQRTLREAGYRIVGPIATAAEACSLIDGGAIDGAIVDLDLDPASVTAIVDLLDRAALPVLFLSGAALGELPRRHRNGTLLAKPYAHASLLQAVGRLLAPTWDDDRSGDDQAIWYPVSSPPSWPRVFPQL